MEIRVSDRPVNLGPAKQQTVLAALLVDVGRPVTADTLIDRVWGENPPSEARKSLYALITRVRRILAATAAATALGDPSAGVAQGPDGGTAKQTILRHTSGYLLDMDPNQVDLHRYRLLAEQARDSCRPVAERAVLLREALGLWRGEPLAGLSGLWAARTRDSWTYQHIETAAAWAHAELLVGNTAAVIARVPDLMAQHPLAEPLVAALMQALYAAGRGPEALGCYAALRERLSVELGTDPGPEAQQVYRAILSGEPVGPHQPVGSADEPRRHKRPAVSGAAVERHGPDRAVPAQLPAPLASFTGRAEQLRQLDALLDTANDQHTAAVVITAIAGTAGVGKTALAVYWASRVADRFPGGQLYVNLRGFHPTGSVMTSAEAILGFLDAFGVPADRIPPGLDAQVGLYRSLVAGKRVLVLLDNARDADQVRPLLPGSSGCLALVTSRNQLTGLVAADGACPLVVDLLTKDEARRLLVHRLGHARVTAATHAVEEIITRCARLPLALSIVAARAATNPRFALSVFARELGDTGSGLGPFTSDDPATDIRGVFSWSYRLLSPAAARLFRLLGLHPGPIVTEPAAAGLAGLRADQVRPLLAELTQAHLIDQYVPGRCTLHDLLREYATELTHTHDPENERRTALRRLLDHYLHSAATASEALSWYRDPVRLTGPEVGVTPEVLTDHGRALAWFAAELPNLTAAVRRAAETGFEAHAWQLAWTLVSFFDLAGRWHEWADTHEVALAAARQAGDVTGEARTRRNLARVYCRQGRHQDAHTQLRQSLNLCRDLGDPVGQAQALRFISTVLGRQGRHREALSHAREALSLLRAAHHLIGQGRALNQIGWQLSLLGDHQQAIHHCRQALRILQEFDDRDGEGAAWDTLGHAHQHLGDHQEAIACFRQALRLRRERCDSNEVAETLVHLGDVHLAAGDFRVARLFWQEALEILDQLGHGDTLHIRGRLRTAQASEATPPSPALDGH
ncbi:tetratricopeptide repeat protein [Streptomyces phyllanthi]|uniref:Tetratricopeptide repeat protein n=1 Tax=Streptomyces phyllanthi TaxID=1803180 RepID=A0A5N8VUS1_9ACTN|nr:tetratricopeptide repeat protein [Streptomyces phyllanthi]MPY39000.1 tetratricopeptide repeat protein [Streptomyces phyllanthi]